MRRPWLADLETETFWAHHTWSEFADLAEKEHHLVILPLFGFADHGLGLPLDIEEVVGSHVLREAVVQSKSLLRYRVLPPLRFGLAPYPHTLWGLDPDTAHDVIREIAEGVRAAGFRTLVFFVTSPWQRELVDAASRDIRVTLDLRTFIIHLSGLGLDFHPASPSREALQRLGSHLLQTLPGEARAGDVSDLHFRPALYRQPPPVRVTFTLADAAAFAPPLLATASQHLARLLGEVAGHVGALPAPAATKNPPPAPAPIEPSWLTYRPRYLGGLTREQVEALPDKARSFVILPTGAIEQHGPHLPVGVDALLGQMWLRHTLPRLPAEAPIYVAPALTYGKSNEHSGFPGTVSLSARTLRQLVRSSIRQLQAWGFRQVGILNTHGGNSAVLVYTLREIQSEWGLRVGMIGQPYQPALDPQEKQYGFHAGEWETALMLAEAEPLVRPERAVCEYPARLDAPGELRPESAPATFSWKTSDISRSGVMGDATRATRAQGERWREEACQALAQRLLALLGEG